MFIEDGEYIYVRTTTTSHDEYDGTMTNTTANTMVR